MEISTFEVSAKTGECPVGVELVQVGAEALPTNLDKLVFFATKRHPRGTCLGEWAEGVDDGTILPQLKGYKKAVVFSSGSGVPLTDERSIWQDRETGLVVINVASVSAIHPIPGRDNYEIVRKLAMDARQLLKVRVNDDDTLSVERRDAITNEELGPAWKIDFSDKTRFDPAIRAKAMGAPQFAAEAKATASVKEQGVTVEFPPAMSNGDLPRAYDYEVTAKYFVDGLDKIALQKRVYSTAFFRAANKEPSRIECWFDKRELVWDVDLTFEVRPLSSYGVKGEAIVATANFETEEHKQRMIRKAKEREHIAKIIANDKGADY